MGIAVRSGILLVSHYNHLLGEGVPLEETVWRGSMERLRPVLMTSLPAGLVMFFAVAATRAGLTQGERLRYHAWANGMMMTGRCLLPVSLLFPRE